MEVQYTFTLGLVVLVVGLVLWLQRRAGDAAAERRHREIVAALSSLRLGEVVAVGPDSSRPVSVSTGSYAVSPRACHLPEEIREEIAAELEGDGPCCPEALAEARGYRVVLEPGLPEETPSRILADGVILARDERRAVLLAVAKLEIDRRGYTSTPADVADLATRLARPRAVRAPAS